MAKSTGQTKKAQSSITPTYEVIVAHLKNNHFYPGIETMGDKITGLRIECPAIILMEDKKLRLEEVLKDYPVLVTTMKNEGYLHIKLKTTKIKKP